MYVLFLQVVERAMFHFENAYYIPNVEVTAHVCKTNLPSNTAFRGFGGPQGMFGAECMLRHLASTLGKTPEELSKLNLYRENLTTHYGQVLTHCTLQKCWDECVEKSNMLERKRNIDNFNKYALKHKSLPLKILAFSKNNDWFLITDNIVGESVVSL